MPGLLTPWHVAILCLLILLMFGPKQLPKVARALGESVRELKSSLTDTKGEIKQWSDTTTEGHRDAST